MSIFKKFKVTFNLRKPIKKAREKDESEVQCIKYRVYSEFSTPCKFISPNLVEKIIGKFSTDVFDTNPRHFQEKPFTPSQSRNLQKRSQSENNIPLKTLSNEEKIEKNNLWPSEIDLTKSNEKNNIHIQTQYEKTNDKTEQNQTEEVPKQRKEKGILKNKHEKFETEKQQIDERESKEDNQYGVTSFNKEITYEHFETIDDQLGEEDIYYFEQKDENKDDYVVHKTPIVHFPDSDHEYEEPTFKKHGNVEETVENPVYNLSTHPKLNPNESKDEEFALSIGLNTFGNTQKLKYPGDYSQAATSIFFDDENDYEC